MYNGDEIGLVLRTKSDVNPVVISVGHKVDLFTTMEFTLESVTGYRQPEPIRQAHLAAIAQGNGEEIDIDVGGNQTSLF
jgi:deoxyribonuclease V